MTEPRQTPTPSPDQPRDDDELALDKETIQDLDPSDPDAAAIQGGMQAATSAYGCGLPL